MKIPVWKKWLSYINDVLIESVESMHSDQLQLWLSKGRYQLCSQNAIYSFEDKYKNFMVALENLDWPSYNVNSVLILGMGMAAIPKILESHLNKDFHYTMIEIDEDVIYLANKYVLKGLNSNFQVIQADAYLFLQQSENQYDMICMDVFIDDKIPENLTNIQSIKQMKKLLNPNGLLMYNMLYKDHETLTDRVFTHCESIFDETWRLSVENNQIIHAKKH